MNDRAKRSFGQTQKKTTTQRYKEIKTQASQFVCYLANKAASAFFFVCVFAGSFGLFRKNDSVGSIIHAMVIDGEGKKKLEEKDNKSSVVIFVFSLLLLLLLLLKPKFNWDWLGMIWGGEFFFGSRRAERVFENNTPVSTHDLRGPEMEVRGGEK